MMGAFVLLAACRSQEPQAEPPAPDAGASAATAEATPAVFKVRLTTSKGDILIDVHRAWAPRAADRFYELVKTGFFSDERFFRVLDQSLVEFGISGDPKVTAAWQGKTLPDDEVRQSNKRGFLSFSANGQRTRATRVFINTVDNPDLDRMGFAPFGEVIEGMTVVDALYKGYGEGAPQGRGPEAARILAEGNTYLRASFPQLDWIKGVELTP